MKKSDKKINLVIYSRCSDDINYYKAIKEVGATSLIVGIEAISDSLLKKMDKGCNVIRNIQCLKYCAEFHLNCIYNLFYGYPNFSERDFRDTMENIDYILGYQPPESLCDMELQYGSRVFFKQNDFEITTSLSDRIEELTLPDGAKTFRYEYYTISDHSKFSQRISEKILLWSNLHEKEGFDVLTYKKRNDLIEIYDKRQLVKEGIIYYTLSQVESQIFLFCESIVTREELKSRMPETDVDVILKELNRKKIMFLTDKECLSIPIRKR